MRFLDCVFVYRLQESEGLWWHQRIHHHKTNQFEIHYFVSGNGSFTNGTHTFAIHPGMLFITPGMMIHNIMTTKEAELTYYATLIEQDPDMTGFINDLSAHCPFSLSSNMRFFFEEIRDKGLSMNDDLKTSACHQVLELLYALKGGTTEFRVAEENISIKKALGFMQAHIFEHLSLQQLADYVKLNPSYFIRLFQSALHISPMKYFTNLQLEASKSLLASTTMSIKEIAARLQFCSEFYFSRCFKTATGISPTQYRKTYLQLPGK